MSSDQWLSREQFATLIELLDTSEYPILVHCEWGAERTGLVSAVAELLRPGASLADARAQFSPYYLFLPMKDGLVMRGHLDRYEGWLAASRTVHSSEAFRRWVAHHYWPGSPSREYWPEDVYPLKVVTRPGGRRVALWGQFARERTIRR